MNKGLEDATGFVLFFLFCYVFSTVCLAVRWNEKVFGFFWDEPPFFLFRGQKNKACFLECLLLQIALYGSIPSGETCHSFLVKYVVWLPFLCENEQRSTRHVRRILFLFLVLSVVTWNEKVYTRGIFWDGSFFFFCFTVKK